MPYAADAGYPVPAGQNELAESLLVPLVSRFGEMQQQMFDQLQQTLGMFVQMFGKMHESQMELVRQEFERLNDLTKEINGLKSELSEMSRKQSEAAVQKPQPTTPTTAGAAPFRPKEAPVKETASLPLENIAPQPRPQAGPSPGGADSNDRDAIVWLHQRITTIQNEREGRWQKILKLLPGAS